MCSLLSHRVGILDKSKEKNIYNVNITCAKFVIAAPLYALQKYYSIVFSILNQFCYRYVYVALNNFSHSQRSFRFYKTYLSFGSAFVHLHRAHARYYGLKINFSQPSIAYSILHYISHLQWKKRIVANLFFTSCNLKRGRGKESF